MLLALLRHLFGEPLPDPPTFDDDLAGHDHVLRRTRDRALHGDWRAARDMVEIAGADWEVRGRRIGALAEAAATDDRWLTTWLRAEPSDPAAVLIQASMLSHRAGEARGSASAKHTTAAQFQAFEELSEAAAWAGRRAMALAGPGDPLPWVEMLGTMFADRNARAGLFEEVFAEGRRRDPFNLALHWTALSLRCQKWGGSHERMFAEARGVAAAAPPGAGVVLLPLYAHFEYALLEFSWDAESDQTVKECRRYFTRPDVRQEVDEWIAKWRAGQPGPVSAVTCRQWLALYYSLAGRRKEARAVFGELPQRIRPGAAWAYFYNGSEYGYLKSWLWAHRL